jgi:hypothetical protein
MRRASDWNSDQTNRGANVCKPGDGQVDHQRGWMGKIERSKIARVEGGGELLLNLQIPLNKGC